MHEAYIYDAKEIKRFASNMLGHQKRVQANGLDL